MKISIKNIFTSIVVIALLFSSFGFDIYKHICTTHNFNAASILEIPECESEHTNTDVADDCCKTVVEEIAESDCCQSEPIEEGNPISLASMDVKCCFFTFESISLNANLFPPVEKKNILVGFISVIVPIDQTDNQITEQITFTNNDLPPPLFGRKFLQSIHQLKLDTPIC